MSVCLRRIEDTTPARSCRLSSTSNALQCLADQFGCECRQFGIRNSNDAFTPHLESRRGGGDFDLEAPVASPDFHELPRPETKCLSQGLGHDDASGTVNGSFHSIQNATTIAASHLFASAQNRLKFTRM